ncbi:MAG: PIG-L family deacetylase [Chloroflexi bacterium]|nr:PIG-L family deacetylase [Chloroflexota bacterium]
MNILVIGAHPDDPDFSAGGVAYLYGRLGHRVKFVSMTNGDAGHHTMGGGPLAWRRLAETRAVQQALGLAAYEVLDNHDGELEPSLTNRRQVIRVIREFQPDLVLGPRPNDYHPDHRYAATLIQDAAYMVTVPNVVSLTPHLRINPVIAYVSDDFQRPYPFTPDVAVDIDEAVEAKVEALHCHTSQVYEWLAYNAMREHEVPDEESARKAWLRDRYLERFRRRADRYRDLLVRFYGAARGARIRHAEAFEGCEYGSRLTEEAIPRLFPFFD